MRESTERDAARWGRRIRRAKEKHLKRTARRLRSAGVAQGRPGGGTPLTEQIVVLDGEHRGNYALYARKGVAIGLATPSVGPPPYRARVDVHASALSIHWDEFGFAIHPDAPRDAARGARAVSLLIADRFGSHHDVVLDADGSELLRLENPWRVAGAGEPQPISLPAGTARRATEPHRPRRWVQCLGLAPRRVVVADSPTGWITTAYRNMRNVRRLVLDASGRTAAVVTRTGGATTTMGRSYVVDVREPGDALLHATALVVPFLWDWYTIAWEAGG
jgi:hypothetical protein